MTSRVKTKKPHEIDTKKRRDNVMKEAAPERELLFIILNKYLCCLRMVKGLLLR